MVKLRKRNENNSSLTTIKRKERDIFINIYENNLLEIKNILTNYNININFLKTSEGSNILHYCVMCERFNCLNYFLSNSYLLLFEENNKNLTPLDLLVLEKIGNFDFRKHGVDKLFEYMWYIKIMVDCINVHKKNSLNEYYLKFNILKKKLDEFFEIYNINHNYQNYQIQQVYKIITEIFKGY